MAKMSPQPEELFKKIQKGQIQSIYFVTGKEDYLRDMAIKEILNRTVDPATKDFNYNAFQGGDVDIKQVVNQIRSFPMLGDRRVVLVRNVDQMDNAAQKILAQCVEEPTDTTVLVLEGRSLPAKSPLLVILKKKNFLFEFDTLYENKIQRWVQIYAKRQNKEIEKEAVYDLIEIVGTDLRQLSNELDKVILFCGAQKIIRNEDVHSVIGISRQFNIFELQKALGKRNLNRALHILFRMLVQGENPAGILIMITRYLTVLWKLKVRNWGTLKKTEIAKEIGVRDYFLDEYMNAAQNYSESQLGMAFHYLRLTDLHLKRSPINVPLVMSIPLIALVRTEIFADEWFNLLYE
ncbi:MAG: DNA polymerase III subunit delta [Patescibacteria group bacterium]|nr:DNA polymerase III subunit delta [Patescibacteria group bacterium]